MTRLARGARLVTLCSPAGMGKTPLLRSALAALADGFPDGAFFAGLADLGRPGLAVTRVAAATGISEEPGVPMTATLAAALAERRLLLGLDGCEQAAGACARLCERLLAAAPGLVVIAASRVPLGLPGEVTWPVPPLRLPGAAARRPGEVAQADAVRLFLGHAAAADPEFALDAATSPAVLAACRATAGLPLAVELTAARWPELAAGDSGPPAVCADDSEAGLQAVIGWSHDLLPPDAQVLLRRLSVLPGWSLEVAERVCADGQLPASRIARLLTRLARTCLIQPDAGEGQYRMPGAVRDYARARLAAAGETGTLHRRLRDYAARRAEYVMSIATGRVPVTWPVLRELTASYAADVRVFRPVLQRCLEDGDTRIGLRMCAQLGTSWVGVGAVGEGIRWVDAFLAVAPAADPSLRGPVLAVRALLALLAGDLRLAQSCADAGAELSRAAGDAYFTAMGLDILARAAISAGDPAQALSCTEEALAVARPASDWWNQVFLVITRASALAADGQPEEARRHAAEAVELARQTGQHWGTSLGLLLLGDLAAAAGDAAQARGHYESALPFVREAMHAPEIAYCLARLGRMALRQGDLAGARAYLTESLELSLRIGARARIAADLASFADLAVREAAPDRAVLLAAAATAVARSAGLPALPRAQRYRDAAASSGAGPGLGAARTARLWAEGQQLTSAAAVALALQPPAAVTAAARP